MRLFSATLAPVITRLYGPEAFGLLALFTSITASPGSIACMRYEMAIMLPKTDKEATNLLGLCAVDSARTVPALYFGGAALPGAWPRRLSSPAGYFL